MIVRARRFAWPILFAASFAVRPGTPVHAQRPNPPTLPGEGAPVLDLSGVRTFASWLEDAEVLAPGAASLSLSVTRWTWLLGRGIGFPAISTSVGLAPRVQASASFEWDTSTYEDGTRQKAFGDTYLSGKVVLVDAATHRVGIAISPLLHVLGNASLEYFRYYESGDMKRLQWALPVHAQVALGSGRAYATAGYFSVGGTFASAAVEVPLGSRVVAFGSLSQSRAASPVRLGGESSESRYRTDVSGGAWITVSPSALLFATVGRTVSPENQNSLTMVANLGLAVYFGRKAPQPATPSLAFDNRR